MTNNLRVLTMRIAAAWLALVMFMAGCAPRSDEGPSAGASGMPGALGTFEFQPDDWNPGELTWWMDSDGIDPGIAGCHIGTDNQGTPNGRLFGEACLDELILVESNPGAGELHSHENDTGYPDRFDCQLWCAGNGFATGVCRSAAAPPCTASARCVCDPSTPERQ